MIIQWAAEITTYDFEEGGWRGIRARHAVWSWLVWPDGSDRQRVHYLGSVLAQAGRGV